MKKPVISLLKTNISVFNKKLLMLLLLISFLPFNGYPQKIKQPEEISSFIKNQSLLMAKRAGDWAKDKTGDILLDGVKEFIQKNKLDEQTAAKILTSVANNKDNLKQIYEGASSTDIQAAALSTQLLLGKIIAENVPETNMSAMLQALTKYPEVVAEASQAAGSLAGGDYYKGAETIGKIIWNQTAIGKGIDKAISLEKAGWDFLIQEQFDAAFKKYKEHGSEGLIRMYSGAAAYVREKYFQGKSVSDEVLSAKMAALFEAAQKEEAAADKEQAKLEKMYEMFKRMEMEGGLIFDFRKHQEQFGITKEADVFDRFLWLNRAIRRNLLSCGIDSWVLGGTLSSENPVFSPEALALFMAFSQGGTPAYKAKFEEIARLHFQGPEVDKNKVDSMIVFIRISAPVAVHTVGLTNYYIPESESAGEMMVSSKYVKTRKQREPVQIIGRNFTAHMEINETETEPKGIYDATITGTFSVDRTRVEELMVSYKFRKPSNTYKADRNWNFTARNIPFSKEGKGLIEYEVRDHDGKSVDFSFSKTAYLYTISEDRTTSNGVAYHYSCRIDSFDIAKASFWIQLQFLKSPKIPAVIIPKKEKQ